MTQKPGEYNISVTIGANFTEIMSHVPGSGDNLNRFSDQRVKGQSHSRWRHSHHSKPFIEFHLVHV